MLRSASRLFILDSNDKILVKGLHSAYVEPLRSVLFNTFTINVENNSQWQLSFTAYDDGSVAFNMLSVESSIWWDGQEYIIKQFQPDHANGFTTFQVTATHVGYEVSRIRQRETKTGTLTYTVNDVLSFYLKGNSLGFTWQVIGKFDKEQITDLGNSSGKDMLDKIVSTWPDAIFYPDNKNIRIYQHDSLAVDRQHRIAYMHNTSDMKLSYDSTSIVNQVKVFGKQKENTANDKTEYYFEPFIVQDEQSITDWGVHPGDDVRDERFTDKNAMRKYAMSQLSPQPSLSIEISEVYHQKPKMAEIRRLENYKDNFVTSVEIVAFTYYPLDKSQQTSITLNNRAKTILNYQSSRQKTLQKALNDTRAQTKIAAHDAKKAFNARIIGTRVETMPVNTRAMVQDDVDDTLPLYTLKVAEDNDDFGLKAGNKFAVQTTADGVEGLDAKIQAGQIKYPIATTDNDGLMSADDKAKLDGLQEYTDATQEKAGLMSPADKLKLDNLKQEPVESIDITDSSTGSIYKLTVSNGEIKLMEGSDKQ